MNIREAYEKALKKVTNSREENVISKSIVASSVRKHKAEVHKGNCGRLVVMAGSVGMTGAAIMASKASMRCGCGLVTLACAQELNTIFEICLTEVMTCPVSSVGGVITGEAAKKVFSLLNGADAFLLGPGLSRSKGLTQLVCELVTNADVNLILDADALNAVSENVDVLKKAKKSVIITPHIGEFSRLTSKSVEEIQSNLEKIARDFAAEFNVTLVLKSHRTIVATPQGEILRNVLGNPGMAKGGSGDVLSGCIASFMAQTHCPTLSAVSGVYFHSLAADMAVMETGEYSLLPTDILEYLKYAVKETYDDIN